MIDVRDIADSAVKALLDRSQAGKTFTLTGPASINLHWAAQAFTAALDRPVKAVAVPPEVVADRIRKSGWGDFVTEDVKKLTGHPARSIEQFARELLAPALARK